MDFARHHSAVLSLCLAAAFLAACESDSSSGGDDPPDPGGDTAAPIVLVQFPAEGTLTDAPSASVTVLVVDPPHFFGNVASVTVAGVPATAAPGNDTWTATVPLVPGSNRLRIEAVDRSGNRDANAAELTIRREDSLWVETAKVAFDSARGEALVLDRELDALFAVRLQDGARTLRSGRGVGAGAAFLDPRDVDHVASRDAAVVIDGDRDAVVLVDLATGARTTLSSPSVGAGPIPLDLRAVAVDAARDRVLVVDDAHSALMAVSLSSGDRTTISSDSVGTGPSLVGPRSVAVELARNRALVVLAVSNAVLAVDLATGNRSLFSTPDAVPGAEHPVDIAVDVFQDRALVADAAALALFEIDLATGVRALLSGGNPRVGLGPAWLRPSGIALHLGSVPLVADGAVDALFEVGAISGDRRVVSGVAHGSGPSFARPSAVSLLPGGWPVWQAPGFLVADAEARALYAWSLANHRELLSGPDRGSGPLFVELADVAASNDGLVTRCILALDAGLPGLVSVDEVSGDRTVVSGPGVGAGPELERPIRFLLEGPTSAACTSPALVLDRPLGGAAALVRVDLASGARSIVSDATRGSGVGFVDPVALELALGEAFVLDAGLPGVLSVDLVTGDREVAFLSPVAFVEPTDMVFHHSELALLIADAGVPALLAANLIPQTVTVVSGLETGSGPSLSVPASLVFEHSATFIEHGSVPLAHVADAARGAILTVDLRTGDRVLATK